MSISGEEAFEVSDASVVDIGIGAGSVPELGVGTEVSGHVGIDFFLEVDADFAEAADDAICSGAAVGSDVAVREGDFVVGWVVGDLLLGVGEGMSGELVAEVGRGEELGRDFIGAFAGSAFLSGFDEGHEWAAEPDGDRDGDGDDDPTAEEIAFFGFLRTRTDVFDRSVSTGVMA